MDNLVGLVGNDVLLGEHLDAVGDELAEAGEPNVGERNANTVRAAAILKAAKRLALNDGRDAKGKCEESHDRRDGKQHGDEPLQAIWRVRDTPMFEGDENLIDGLHQG